MKKVLLVLLALIMVLSMMTTAMAVPNGKVPPGQVKKIVKSGMFDDTESVYDWAGDAIGFMAQNGVIRGVGGSKFVPNRSAKEIEVIVMLLRMLDAEDALDNKLSDEYDGDEPDEWMIPYINLAINYGILLKEDFPEFNPNSAASREEVALYVMRVLDNDEFNLDLDEDISESLLEEFEDTDDIDDKYMKYVGNAYKLQLMIGYNHKFQPKKAISRAECAVLMHRIFNNFEFNFEFRDNDKNENKTTGILLDIDYDHTTIEAITLDIDDDTDDIEFDEFDEELEIEVANNCYKNAEDELDDIDDDKYLSLEVDVYEEDGVVTRIIVHYDELQGKLDLSEEQEDNFANIDPSSSSSTTEYSFDDAIEIFMNSETMTADDFDEDDNDFEFHDVDDLDYEIEARLLGNGDIIELCITAEYKFVLLDYTIDDKDTSSENDDELESIKVEIGEDDIEFELATDYEISPDYNDIDDLKEILDDIIDDDETVKFKVNGENEVIELDLD